MIATSPEPVNLENHKCFPLADSFQVTEGSLHRRIRLSSQLPSRTIMFHIFLMLGRWQAKSVHTCLSWAS